MHGAAFRLPLLLVVSLALQPVCLGQSVPPTVESEVRVVVDELFAAYAKKDLDGYMKLWSANSPHLAEQRKAKQGFFAANEKIEVKTLKITKVKVDGDKASVRVAVDITAVDTKTTKPSAGVGKMNRVLDLIKEQGRWAVWREVSAAEDLAAALISAVSDEQRNMLLAANKELMTADLWKALVAQGTNLRLQGKYKEAMSAYTIARNVSEQIGDKTGITQSLLQCGVVQYRQGNLDLSLDFLRKSLALSESSGYQETVAELLTHFAIVHYLQANYELSLEYYQKSLALSETLGIKSETATALTGIGNIHYRRGNYDLTLDYYRKALALREAMGNKNGIAYSLNNLAVVNHVLGNHGLALNYYQKSLALTESLNETPEIPRLMNNIGTLYQSLRNYPLALEYFEKSFKIAEKLGDKITMTYGLSKLGEAYQAQGNYIQALECFKKSLSLAETLRDKQKIATALDDIGGIYEAQGNYTKALEFYQKSLDLNRELGLKPAITGVLNHMGRVHNLQANYSRAIELFESTASIAREISQRETLWYARNQAGRAYRSINQPALAREAFEEAIVIVESLREQVVGSEQEQLRYFENKVSPYHGMVELLVSENKSSEAIQYAERAKARVLLDILRSGKRDIAKAMNAQEIERERRLRNELVSINSQVSRESQRPKPDESRLADLKARLQKARSEYQEFETNLYVAHPELSGQRGEAKPVTLEEAAGLLPDAQAALLEFVVTDTKTYLFVMTAGHDTASAKLQCHTLAIKRNDLAEQVKEFRQQLARRELTFQPAASKLYETLLGPAREVLRSKQTVIIVPDDVLWELPFQALVNEKGRYLIEQHALSYAPSITVLREMRKLRKQDWDDNASSKALIALGNPELKKETTDRVRLVHRDERLEPLPEAEREVKTLGQLYGHKSLVYIGADAREDRFKSEAGRFSVLHLATHGILNDASPMYSQVVLAQSSEGTSEDGLLEAWEIINLNLNADLVVLSACETGRGRIGAGEGMIGLTWAFFVAGSPTTVVSQWKVESASTSRLMIEFHRHLMANTDKSQVSKAEALQKAAIKLLRSKEFVHPFYWAGFILVGDGR